MKFFKTKKGIIITVLVLLAVFLIIRHIMAENSVFYNVPYEKVNITDTLNKDSLSDDDYMLIFEQTGVSPSAAKELVNSGDTDILEQLHNLYFNAPVSQKNHIAYPFTLEERNKDRVTPLIPLKKGDILVTFNTRTLDWRHGHCGIVLNDTGTQLLEHMSIGEVSCVTDAFYWGKYPAFIVLRYSDEKVAEKAADYAHENLVGIPYSIFAGIAKKDKTGEETPTSHCSHIVWQAFKSQGADIDKNGGLLVTPRDIAMSDKLQVVQIYGLNPKDCTSRILK